MEEQLAKAQKKQLRANNKLLKENLEEEKRVARKAAKVVREKEKAEQAAGKECQQQACDAAKATQLYRRGKRKASQSSTQEKKRQKRVVDVPSHIQAGVAAQQVPPKRTRTRSIQAPKKI
jgi:hypothetical protein